MTGFHGDCQFPRYIQRGAECYRHLGGGDKGYGAALGAPLFFSDPVVVGWMIASQLSFIRS